MSEFAPAAVPTADTVPSNVFGVPPQYVPPVSMPVPGGPASTMDYAAAVALYNNGAAAPGVALAPAQPANLPQATTVPQPPYQAPAPTTAAVPVNSPAQPSAPPDLQAKLAQIAEDYGVAPHLVTAFKDEDSALAAISMFASQAAVSGLNYTGTPPANPYPQYAQQPAPYQQQQVPALPALPADILKLDLEDPLLDEKSVGNFKQLQAAYLQQQQYIQQLAGKVEAVETMRRDQVRSQNLNTANRVVDELGDPRYGTAKARTPAQEYAIANLFRRADEIQVGYYQNGLPVPSIDKVVRQALLHDRPYSPAPAQTVQEQVAEQYQAPAPLRMNGAPPVPRPAVPVPTNLKPTSHLGNLHADPAFMSVAARLLSRP